MTWMPEVKEIHRRRQIAEDSDSTAAEKHHAAGKLTVRERMEGLLDSKSSREVGTKELKPAFQRSGRASAVEQAGFVKEGSMNSTMVLQPGVCYELRFQSLLRPGRGWAFPCNAEGQVDMDVMTERVRNNYLFARALVGIDFDAPRVRTTPFFLGKLFDARS